MYCMCTCTTESNMQFSVFFKFQLNSLDLTNLVLLQHVIKFAFTLYLLLTLLMAINSLISADVPLTL